MAPPPEIIHLPNGQTVSVTQVFGGFSFKTIEQDLHKSPFPPGWTVVLDTEDEPDEQEERLRRRYSGVEPLHPHLGSSSESSSPEDRRIAHRFTKPTLQRDALYLSSISIPSSNDFQSAKSPTRQIAMMVWATLNWYFHKEEPNPHVVTEASRLTPESGRPKADWRVNIRREGILKGKNLLPKLERMGLITSEDSSVGINTDTRALAGYSEMFVSRRAFWQIDARIYLFSLPPTMHSPFHGSSPHSSRPTSPARTPGEHERSPRSEAGLQDIHHHRSQSGATSPGGPFASGSHLPTYYPPAPPQYVFTNNIRHPLRPKPPRQGEVFYTRFIPSVGQWLSFRVPSLSEKACTPSGSFIPSQAANSSTNISTLSSPSLPGQSDVEILHKWMNDPRVNAAWGCSGPQESQHQFLSEGLSSRHSFPVFGCWDGKPFGYFEIYWVKEDLLGKLLGGEVGNFARGLHVLIGEQEFRGAHRVKIWLSALVHYCLLADPRTETVMLEPRVDNEKFINYLHQVGFYRSGEVTFPHKQSAIMKIQRDAWEAPAI